MKSITGPESLNSSRFPSPLLLPKVMGNQTLTLPPSVFSSLRDLRESALCHRNVLWHRAALCLSLRLLEALLVAVER